MITSEENRKRYKLCNKYTGQYKEPDERLMRSIEEKIQIPESRKDDFDFNYNEQSVTDVLNVVDPV